MILQGAASKVNQVTEEDLQIYRKYLGNDYVPGKSYSILIANHISYIEIINNFRLGVGFVAKDEVEKIPIVGLIVKATEGLFINRDNKDSKSHLLDEMSKRQSQTMSGEREIPLLIYPEGTISNGTHLLPFKKGAFHALYPVKPIITTPIYKNNYDLSSGAMEAYEHQIISYCYFQFSFSYKLLPIIEYTDFAKKNKKDPNENDEITFTHLVYEIMREVGKFERTDKSLNEFRDYTKKIKEYTRSH